MNPKEVTHVLYHADCLDGFGSALAAWKVLKDKAVYLPVAHGEPPPQLPESAVVAMLDFSYKRPLIFEIKNRVADMIVLDHHLTAQKELEGLEWAKFDMLKSGARMSWEFWHQDVPIPELLAYIEDKDLWNWKLEQSREVAIALHSYPMDFPIWNKLEVAKLKLEGATLLRLQEKIVAGAIKRARFVELFGYRVPIANATDFSSEVANRLCALYPECCFAATYHDDKDGQKCWSLRSIGDFDVSNLARLAGGGGHKNASGFNGEPPKISSVTSAG